MSDRLRRIEVSFSPAEFATLRSRNLEGVTCAVFDVLRATSSIVTALNYGADGVFPVETIEQALEARKKNPQLLLAGERNGLRISAEVSGGVEFDLGNSPSEYMTARIKGRSIATTTTNGTRALRACAHAQQVLAASFLNLQATVECVVRSGNPELIAVCAGTMEEAAYEDMLGAGALVNRLVRQSPAIELSDSAMMARVLFLEAEGNLPGALVSSRNGKRLNANPDLRGDIAFCAQMDRFSTAIRLDKTGWLRPGVF